MNDRCFADDADIGNGTKYLARDQARGEDPKTQLKEQSDIGMVHSISPLCMPDLTRKEAPIVPFDEP